MPPRSNTGPSGSGLSGSGPPASSLPAKYAAVGKKYQEVWKACPYTNFALFNYMVTKAPAIESLHIATLGTWEKFFTGSNTLKAHGLAAKDVPTQNLPEDLWKSNSGLCTSFCIRVAEEAGLPSVKYGDTGSHRASWSRETNTAVVIDSSARVAVGFGDITKKNEETAEYDSGSGPKRKHKLLKWRWGQGQPQDTKDLYTQTIDTAANSSSSAPAIRPDYQKFEERATKEQALAGCLAQILPQNSMILMFRSFKGKANFFGRIDWNFSVKTFTFSGFTATSNYSGTVKFDRNNRDDTKDTEAVLAFAQWLEATIPGGGTREKQFEDVSAIHNEVWEAARRTWGNASLTFDDKPSGGGGGGSRQTGNKVPAGSGGRRPSGQSTSTGASGSTVPATQKTGPRNTSGMQRGGFVDQAVAPAAIAVLKGAVTTQPKSQTAAS